MSAVRLPVRDCGPDLLVATKISKAPHATQCCLCIFLPQVQFREVHWLYHKITACSHHRTLDNIATQENSAIRSHSKKCKATINFKDFKILYSTSSKQSLLIAESLLIKKLSPKLNSDQASTPLYIA